MLLHLARLSSPARLRAVGHLQTCGSYQGPSPFSCRTIFSLFRKAKSSIKPEPQPILSEDNLFHPFSKSPFPAVRARGEAIQSLAPCPVCASSHDHLHAHTKAQPRSVKFECPDCGWPTHCTEEHWGGDVEHQKYCSRLREANEDEHDLRSGRRMREFELPGKTVSSVIPQPTHVNALWPSRTTGYRSRYILRQLGRLLVHP